MMAGEFSEADHHVLLADKLQEVAEGETTRLIINMPPRHGKSLLASQMLPAWYLGRFPNREVIFATASQTAAEQEYGPNVLNTVQHEKFKNVFPEFALKTNKPRQDGWKTKELGGYFACGKGAQITGRGAQLLIVDDPIKGPEDANSKGERDKLWNWFTTVLYTRQTNIKLPPDKKSSIVVIQTRWHEDDLAGRLVEQMELGGENWTVLNIPALKTYKGTLPTDQELQKGDNLLALWPRIKTVEDHLIAYKQDPNGFKCLQQQDPTPDDGIFFKKEWLTTYEPFELPKLLNFYGCSDFALTESAGDYTEHMIVGLDAEDNIWLVDGYTGQDNMFKWGQELLRLAATYKPRLWVSEVGPARRASEPVLKRMMKETRTYVRMEYMTRVANKVTSAMPLQARAANGKLKIPNNAWGRHVKDQILKFPATKHDDAVDALSNFCLALDKAHPALVPPGAAKTISRRRAYDFDALDNTPNWRLL